MAGMVIGDGTATRPVNIAPSKRRSAPSPRLVEAARSMERGILINITGSNSLKLPKCSRLARLFRAPLTRMPTYLRAVLDEKMKDAVKITVIATGFKEADMRRPRHHDSFDPVIISREARGMCASVSARLRMTL